jgi:coenzyme F420 hydrogenase subunit delta
MEYTGPEYLKYRVLVLGCGNELFGDDGFGSEAARYLSGCNDVPPYVGVIDAGLSIRNILFDIVLSEKKPEKIIIIDAVDCGRTAGDVFELDLDDIPLKKVDDFSMHQLPTTNLLKELKEQGDVEVRVIGVQVKTIPDKVMPGISEPLRKSLIRVKEKVIEIAGGNNA